MSVIVHLITGLEVGGAERMLEKTLPRLPRWEHVVCSILPTGPIAEHLRAAGIRVESLNAQSAASPRALTNLIRFLRDLRPDLLQTYLVHADVLGVLASRPAGVRRVVVSIRSKLNEAKFWPILTFYTVASPLVERFLCNSPASAVWFRRLGLPLRKIVVIPNGVEIPTLRKPDDRRGERRRLGLPADGPLVVSVGKLRSEKGHRYLLKAVASLIPSFSTLTVGLVGKGPLEAELRQHAVRLGIDGHVRFLGNRDDIWSILLAADAFVLPSMYEGMSNALLEAMAAGVPIVATDLPENRVLIGPNDAYLVPPRDPAAIASALRDVFINANPAAARVARARQRVVENFSISKAVTLLDEFYGRLLDAS